MSPAKSLIKQSSLQKRALEDLQASPEALKTTQIHFAEDINIKKVEELKSGLVSDIDRAILREQKLAKSDEVPSGIFLSF